MPAKSAANYLDVNYVWKTQRNVNNAHRTIPHNTHKTNVMNLQQFHTVLCSYYGQIGF